MKLKFLGSGTSQGVPVIGCHCEVCTSQNPKDRRFRSSALITTDAGKKILIDCGPDFRMQMLENNEEHVDALLLTHEHNDHVIGLDDMRPLIFRSRKDIPIYCSKRVGDEIKQRFPYAFAEVKYPGAPSFEPPSTQGADSRRVSQTAAMSAPCSSSENRIQPCEPNRSSGRKRILYCIR